jgi:class 3 adenylate cyclase
MRETNAAGHTSTLGRDPTEPEITRFGWLAFLGAGASIASCYAVKLSRTLEPVLGTTTISLNPHVQAVLMWGFALVAVIAIARDRRHHAQNLPLAVATIAFLFIVGTLYTHYDTRVETLGYVALVVAAFLNQNAILGQLNRTVQAQAKELAVANASLEQRVERQVDEIERLARLRRFLAPEIAELITSEGKEALLNSHRGFVACVFCDIRNFTALSDGVEPEEVMDVLQTYHRELGRLVGKHGGTIGYRSGDGLMVIINDPIPVDNPAREAVALARDMMAAFEKGRASWQKLGYDIGFGIGLASGYATLGLIGDEGRFDYTAIGNVINLAARLCDHAEDGEILINRRIFVDIEESNKAVPLGALELKGFNKPVDVFRLADEGNAPKVVKPAFGEKKS